MNMLGRVVAMLAVVLVSREALAVPIPVKTFFDHPAPSEELTREDILANLRQLEEPRSQGDAVGLVLENLYKAKDKDSTELVDGLTVAKLIALNHIQFEGCSKEAMRDRLIMLKTLEMLLKDQSPKDRAIEALILYMFQTFLRAASFVAEHKGELISAGLVREGEYEEYVTKGFRSRGF